MNPSLTQILERISSLHKELSLVSGTRKKEILGKIKLMSAQMYLEADMEIIALGGSVEEVKEREESTISVPESQLSDEQMDINNDEDLQNENEDSQTLETEDLQKNQFATELENSVDLPQQKLFEMEEEEVESEADELELSENEEDTIDEDDFITGIRKDYSSDVKQRANDVMGMFSLTRRYEFVNFLFGGEMEKFSQFLCEMITAQSVEDRDSVYHRWHSENDWKRRDEAASDLLRNIKKML
ncbi:MAG: hypothetical protein ACON5K_01150 [Bacteroidia bacterium]